MNNINELFKEVIDDDNNGLAFNNIIRSYEELQQDQIQKPRYGLAALVGHKVRCQAVILPGLRTKAKYDGKEINMRTLININRLGKLVADHIQVNLYGEIYYGEKKWENEETDFTRRVDIVGIVYEYKSGDEIKYSIALTEKPRFQDDKLLITEEVNYTQHINENLYETIYRQGLTNYKVQFKKLIIKKMKIRLNELTLCELPTDFIWNYIINQFTLNTLSIYMNDQEIDLYLDQLTTLQCDLLINVLSYILTIFESQREEFKLYDIFKMIVILCSKAQGVKTFDKQDNDFIRFASHFDISDIRGKRGWSVVRMRVKNYKLNDNDLLLENHKMFKQTNTFKRAMCITHYIEQIKNNL